MVIVESASSVKGMAKPRFGSSLKVLKGTATLMITIFYMKDLNKP